jgi:hypothetical protein
LVITALATRSHGQPAATNVANLNSLNSPTNNTLVLSNAAGKVRVLDSQGLVLETNYNFLPRIKLADLSPDELRALLETKTAYATLTTFPSLYGTNALGSVLESQLEQVWRRGNSLAEKIQARLEILQDLREYNITVASLPASMAAVGQYSVNADVADDRVADREADLGSADSRQGRHEEWERFKKANDRALAENGQAVASQQQVADSMAKCAALSGRLASHGISVPAAPPFALIPPMTMKAEVDAVRMAN